jgi:hypothetical protein
MISKITITGCLRIGHEIIHKISKDREFFKRITSNYIQFSNLFMTYESTKNMQDNHNVLSKVELKFT